MTAMTHRALAAGRWQELTLVEQLANIGSEVGRALRAKGDGRTARAPAAFDRALELFDLTLADGRWRGRRREITRAREMFTGQFLAGNGAEDEGLEPYFLQFAAASRRQPARLVETSSRVAVVPDLDLARVRRYCRERIPAHLRDCIRLDVEVTGRRIAIVERRAPWSPEIGPEWTASRIAQLRLAIDSTWTLFWSDGNNVWHRDPIDPTPHVEGLLAQITEDPANRYWG